MDKDINHNKFIFPLTKVISCAKIIDYWTPPSHILKYHVSLMYNPLGGGEYSFEAYICGSHNPAGISCTLINLT